MSVSRLVLAGRGLVLVLSTTSYAAVAASPSPAVTPALIEADWERQDAVREAAVGLPGNATTVQDAAGGCDGVKSGQWGFHTSHEKEPWWQVDLGESLKLERVLLFNRCDGFADRNSRVRVLLSDDGQQFQAAYEHDGTVFLGQTDNKPLVVSLSDRSARFIRLQLPATDYFHLDEVEVYAAGRAENVALKRPADQSSTSQWSARHEVPGGQPPRYYTDRIVARGEKLAKSLQQLGADVTRESQTLADVAARWQALPADASADDRRALDHEARWTIRKMAFRNPLIDFDEIVFVKRAPGLFPHMSDQYYGWWSRGGGGVYVLSQLRSDNPQVRCLTEQWPAGTFLRPDLSYDGRRILVSWCKYYPQVAAMEKVDKEKLPEDAFFHLYEMDLEGGQVRQLTRGFYDDFDGRYLPDGGIAFLSTRKGTAIQVSRASVAATTQATCPDSFVRCGGDNRRPVAVFTLHRMKADGSDLCPISAFENFEWTPAVGGDGRVIYARWDYIDRFNGPFISLWSANPDGTRSQLVYGNYTVKPQCVFEACPIPQSHKLVFTASAHHSITGGSLALLDTTVGNEFERPLTRLTPEVPFPETEAWTDSYYASPYPLSEEHYLVAWSDRKLPPHRLMPPDDVENPRNAQGIYLYDAFGNLTLLHRDPEISSTEPLPVRPRLQPPVVPSYADWDGPQEGNFLLQDVYRGLADVPRGAITRLRIVGVPPKVQPHMNEPALSVSREDPGKYVLGTVPVESDGSAHFRVPSGIPLLFQALDAEGYAVQTMRSLTYVQPGEVLTCVGCHEPRNSSPPNSALPLAARRPPSPLTPGPAGSWPLRFDQLVQPVLDKKCTACHRADSADAQAAALVLTADRAYESLLDWSNGDLRTLAFEKDQSFVGQCAARQSKLLRLLTGTEAHYDARLDAQEQERLTIWMDTYAYRVGSFSSEQEEQLRQFRQQVAHLLSE
jgi:hypothetical protein